MGIPDENEETSERTKAVLYKFLEEEVDIKDPHKKWPTSNLSQISLLCRLQGGFTESTQEA